MSGVVGWLGPGVMGELVHRGGEVIMAKIWWVGWGPQVVGGWARCGGWWGDCGQDVVGGGVVGA